MQLQKTRLGWLLVVSTVGLLGMIMAWVVARVVSPSEHLVFEWCSFVPTGAIASTAAFVAWRGARRGASRVAWCALALAVLFVVKTGAEQRWIAQRVSAPPATITLMHWNVCRGWFLGAVIDQVKQRDADLWVLAEVPEEFDPARFQVAATWRIDNLLFGCRRGRWDTRTVEPIYGARVHAAEWSDGDQQVLVCAVDIDASIFNSRARILDALAERLRVLRPDVLVGDFNTPRDSAMFEPIRGQLRHAYDAVGSGWSGTWPLPLPLFAIDQVFFGPKIEPCDYSLFSTFCSDHRGQLFEFSLR